MQRFELTISPNYVPHWELPDAIRELFQNGMDEERMRPENKFSFEFSGNTLILSNKESILKKSSLLFGESEKSNDKLTVGSFGEGYKIASLVLLRNDYDIKIHNYAEKETWTPKLINSKRYNSKLLVVDISKSIFKKSDCNLSIIVTGLTDYDIKRIYETNLILQNYNSIKTSMGEILTDPHHKCMLFVGGLYVCKNDKLSYGYNFNPEHLKVDRDRRLVADFETFWQTSMMWNLTNEIEKQAALVESDAYDVAYLSNTELSNIVCSTFLKNNGEKSVPVYDQDTYDYYNKEFDCNPIIVSERKFKIIRSSNLFKVPGPRVLPQTPERILSTFFNTFGDDWTSECINEFKSILELSKTWNNNN